jgi:RNA polymerase sigma-70 factor (ECF subfamily)
MEPVQVHAVEKDGDTTLVTAAKRGDARAFEKLVSRHQRSVLGLAHTVTKNQQDAEDVVQASLQKAFLHLGSFEERSRFATWLTRIVLNEAYLLLRRRRTAFTLLAESSENDAKSASDSIVDHSPDPEESCWRRERHEILARAINRLRPNIRSAIILHLCEARSATEMAKVLGISTAAVKSRLFHGRRILRTALGQESMRKSCRRVRGGM